MTDELDEELYRDQQFKLSVELQKKLVKTIHDFFEGEEVPVECTLAVLSKMLIQALGTLDLDKEKIKEIFSHGVDQYYAKR